MIFLDHVIFSKPLDLPTAAKTTFLILILTKLDPESDPAPYPDPNLHCPLDPTGEDKDATSSAQIPMASEISAEKPEATLFIRPLLILLVSLILLNMLILLIF